MTDVNQALKQLEDEGFSLDDLEKSELSIAFLSLRSAFRSWFTTYQCFRWQFHIADPNNEMPVLGAGDPAAEAKLIRQRNHPTSYFEQYSETIFHFQHFIELVIKDILRKEHELLVSDAARHPLILWKLLSNEEITGEETQKLFSVEFSEALKRIVAYIGSDKLDSAKFGFIKDGEPILQKLNNLRNRLVHRGTFVLPYASLDEFIGRHLLPIVIAITEFPEYKKEKNFWKYQDLSCHIDPIDEIFKEFQGIKIVYGKVAFLKELGRAAFHSPIQKRGVIVDLGDRSRAELLATKEAEKNTSQVYDVLACPVCGVNSLVRLFDIETQNPDPEDPGEAWLSTYNVQCFCCSFEINGHLKNASEYGLDIEDYWLKEDLE